MITIAVEQINSEQEVGQQWEGNQTRFLPSPRPLPHTPHETKTLDRLHSCLAAGLSIIGNGFYLYKFISQSENQDQHSVKS